MIGHPSLTNWDNNAGQAFTRHLVFITRAVTDSTYKFNTLRYGCSFRSLYLIKTGLNLAYQAESALFF